MQHTPKLHTTNYYNTFIEVEEDSKAPAGNKPASKAEKSLIKKTLLQSPKILD